MSHPTVHLAIDLGAESGRAIAGVLDNQRLTLHELHRFSHAPISLPSGLHWDLPALWRGVLASLTAAIRWSRDHALPLRSVGVDTWGVDYALLGHSGELLGLPYCYRDPRTAAAFQRLMRHPGAAAIYDATGIQPMPLNTLVQLVAHLEADPERLAAARRLLFMPDLFHYRLSGVACNEATIASTSQMLDPRTGGWADRLLETVGVPRRLLATPSPPATRLGPLRPDVVALLAPDAGAVEVILPASHDTASAVAAAPAPAGAKWCYLSSGTWSLLGAELDAPCFRAAARVSPFTNEGGLGGTIRFHRNLTGLWLVQQCRRAFAQAGAELNYATLTALAASAPPLRTVIDAQNAAFAQTGDMPARIAEFARRTGQPEPQTPGQYVRCCLESLAISYRRTLADLESVLQRRFDVIHVLGGGGRNALLNQMTADATGRRVVVGPIEATAAGSVLVQAIGAGIVRDGAHARQIATTSFTPALFEPNRSDAAAWTHAATRIAPEVPADAARPSG